MLAIEEAVLFVGVSRSCLNGTKEQLGMLTVECGDLDVKLKLKLRCCGGGGESVDVQEVHVAP